MGREKTWANLELKNGGWSLNIESETNHIMLALTIFLSEKSIDGKTANWTRDLIVSSQSYQLGHKAYPFIHCFCTTMFIIRTIIIIIIIFN